MRHPSLCSPRLWRGRPRPRPQPPQVRQLPWRDSKPMRVMSSARIRTPRHMRITSRGGRVVRAHIGCCNIRMLQQLPEDVATGTSNTWDTMYELPHLGASLRIILIRTQVPCYSSPACANRARTPEDAPPRHTHAAVAIAVIEQNYHVRRLNSMKFPASSSSTLFALPHSAPCTQPIGT